MQGEGAHLAGTAKRPLLRVSGFLLAVVGTAALAAPVAQRAGADRPAATVIERSVERILATPAPERLIWEGADIDGDGQADFANPTGKDTRKTDAYGDGEFGASRDGGSRRHEGVDFVAEAGQPLVAPISGYVTKIGLAYPGDESLTYVEISNPALRYAARVFYIDPAVQVGDAVQLGEVIGAHQSLEERYPDGMTDHVHLEILNTRRGRRIDAAEVITARYVRDDAGSRG